MSKHVEDGTRSRCRFCKEPVVWTLPKDEGEGERMRTRFYHPRWWHIGTRGKEYKGQVSEETRFKLVYMTCETLPEEVREEIQSAFNFSAYAAPQDFCVEHTQGQDSWDTGHVCNRPVKDTELFMCGLHAAHVRRRQKQEEDHSEHRALERHMEMQLDPFIKELNEFWGLDASMENRTANTFPYWYYTGMIVVNPGRLREILADRIEEF